jgi:predicted DNA-binding transcriptional regulator YafY
MIRAGRFPNATRAAGELEVHPRTVHRDLEFLRDSLHAPLEFSRKQNGYFYREADYALPLLRLTEGELVAFFLAEQLMEQYKGTPYAEDLAGAFQKITKALPDEVTVDLSHLGQSISFRPVPATAGEISVFRQLARSVRESRQLELHYWSAWRGETCRRVVDPYHLAAVGGDWYLVAYCHLREDVRMFVPSRIRHVKETGKQFDRPADFCIGEYLDGSFRTVRGGGPPQTVRLRFQPAAARYVRERTWHPTQKLDNKKNGSLEMTLKVNHLLEVRRWVLSWGRECEVLSPAQLRDEVTRELLMAVGQYRGIPQPRRSERKPRKEEKLPLLFEEMHPYD